MSAVDDLKDEFKEIECELVATCKQVVKWKVSEMRVLNSMTSLYENLRLALEVEHGVKIPTKEFQAFVMNSEGVMVIEDGKVCFFEEDAEGCEGAVKIYASDWNSEWYTNEMY